METHLATDSNEPKLRSLDDLLAPFTEACKPVSEFRVGTEAEKFGVDPETFAPIEFEGDRGVKRVLRELADRYGWEGDAEVPGGPVIALRRGRASITLEPGGQLELSGAPLATIHETHAEMEGHLDELSAISRDLGITWLGLGFHPFATREELPNIPKLRYGVMRQYLPTKGQYAIDMMKRTATVQANLDYASEADAIRKLRVSLALQPIVSAMFANSPFWEGRVDEQLSIRVKVWSAVDPDRTGYLPFAFDDDMSFRRYVEWALDVPMFLFKRNGQVVANTGQSFRAFMKDGFRGYEATKSDWVAHLNTLFPEVRLKNTLEMRGADNQGRALVSALPALWRGILYGALDEAETLASKIDPSRLEGARFGIAQDGLRAQFLNEEHVSTWAHQVLDVATRGLAKLGVKSDRGQDETIHLAALRVLIDREQCPADVLVEGLDGLSGDALKAKIVERTRIA